MNPLDGAYQRLDRVGEHLADLRRRGAAVGEVVIDNTAVQHVVIRVLNPDGSPYSVIVSLTASRTAASKVPFIISTIVGETIYNLRAALDYLVYELAQLDAGKIVKKTQFPIEDTKNGFHGRRNTYLRGVSDAHIEQIKLLQPFNGCNWTGTLRDVSNPDKHQHLTYATAKFSSSLPPGRAETIIAGETMGMKGDLAVYIAFSDGTPIIDTLEQLKLKVADTLDEFKPDFK